MYSCVRSRSKRDVETLFRGARLRLLPAPPPTTTIGGSARNAGEDKSPAVSPAGRPSGR